MTLQPASTQGHHDALRAALRELREASGVKPWLLCRFGFNVASQLIEAGWARIDEGPIGDACVRLTASGREASRGG